MNVIKGKDEKGKYYKNSHNIKYYYETIPEQKVALERVVGGELLGGMIKKVNLASPSQAEVKPPKEKKQRAPKTRIKKTRATGQKCKVKQSSVGSELASSPSSSSEEYM